MERRNGGRRDGREDRSREGGCGRSPVSGRANGGRGEMQEGEVEREEPEVKFVTFQGCHGCSCLTLQADIITKTRAAD